MQEIYLQPGDLYFGVGPVRLVTLLGSCVSVLLWHETRHLGGMCHFMLPTRAKAAAESFEGRYADEAFALFRREIEAVETRTLEYQVILFGGGNMFSSLPRAGLNVGERNIHAARVLLPKHGFTIAREDVGGVGYRRLSFDLATGEINCTRVDGRRSYSTTEHAKNK